MKSVAAKRCDLTGRTGLGKSESVEFRNNGPSLLSVTTGKNPKKKQVMNNEALYGHSFFFSFFDGYCSAIQGLLDWFEVDLGFTKLLFIQTDLCVLCVFLFYFLWR